MQSEAIQKEKENLKIEKNSKREITNLMNDDTSESQDEIKCVACTVCDPYDFDKMEKHGKWKNVKVILVKKKNNGKLLKIKVLDQIGKGSMTENKQRSWHLPSN